MADCIKKSLSDRIYSLTFKTDSSGEAKKFYQNPQSRLHKQNKNYNLEEKTTKPRMLFLMSSQRILLRPVKERKIF